MQSTRRTLIAFVAVVLLFVTPPLAAAAGHPPGNPWPAAGGWVDWFQDLVSSLWPGLQGPEALVGRAGGDVDPNGTPAGSADAGSTTGTARDSGLSTLIGREGGDMDPNGTPTTASTEESAASAFSTSPAVQPPGS